MSDPVGTSITTPLHLLVVEDKEVHRAAMRSALAEVARQIGGEAMLVVEWVASYEDAYEAVLASYFDVMIVDLVLHEGPLGEPEEWEGFWLLQDLAELDLQDQTAVIVLTDFGDNAEIANRAFSEYGVHNFWSKTAKDEILAVRLVEFLRRHLWFGLSTEVSVEAADGWGGLVSQLGDTPFRRLRISLSRADASLELNHLIRRIFRDADNLVVAPMTAGKSGAGVLRIRRQRDGGRLADVLVKYGAAGQVRDEAVRWAAMRDYFQDYRFTQLSQSAAGRYLGVVSYNLIGASPEAVISFEDFYRAHDVNEIARCLDRVFGQTCELWYSPGNVKPRVGFALQEHYEDFLGAPAADIVRAFEFKYGRSALANPVVAVRGLARPLPHPVVALRDGWRLGPWDTVECRTHGDLHGQNLLVDRAAGDAWMIDFGRAGIGHWARDFAMLECCIKFQYVPTTSEDQGIALEVALSRQGRLAQELPTLWDEDPYLDKGARVVAKIRAMAAQAAGGMDPERAFADYQVALLFTTCNYFRIHSVLKKPARKRHVLAAAALVFSNVAEGRAN